jgi:hypothetical protein
MSQNNSFEFSKLLLTFAMKSRKEAIALSVRSIPYTILQKMYVIAAL